MRRIFHLLPSKLLFNKEWAKFHIEGEVPGWYIIHIIFYVWRLRSVALVGYFFFFFGLGSLMLAVNNSMCAWGCMSSLFFWRFHTHDTNHICWHSRQSEMWRRPCPASNWMCRGGGGSRSKCQRDVFLQQSTIHCCKRYWIQTANCKYDRNAKHTSYTSGFFVIFYNS